MNFNRKHTFFGSMIVDEYLTLLCHQAFYCIDSKNLNIWASRHLCKLPPVVKGL